MKLFKLYTLLIVGLMFASCRPKPIDIQVDSTPSKMVVFSHAVPGNYVIANNNPIFFIFVSFSKLVLPIKSSASKTLTLSSFFL